MRLPNEYQEVEYIQSERTQKINTGINADYKLSIDAEIAILGDGAMGVIKYLGSSQYTRHHFNNSNNRTAYYYRGVSATLQEPYDTDKHHYNIDIYNKEIQFDNGEKRIITYENFDAELNYWLFARNSNVNNLKYNLPMKLYSFKMYYAGTPVRDFVPCFRKSDNEIGLYDLINNQFYTNEGTGTFTKGDSVYYTADKLTYLRETKSLLKDKINDLTGEITDESTFAEYAEAIENLYDELPKVSGDGTEVTLANVKAGKMVIQPKGNTSQYSTTGKNLLPNIATTQTIYGVTFTVNEDKTILANGQNDGTANSQIYIIFNNFTLPAGSYVLTGCPSGGGNLIYRLAIQDDSWNVLALDIGSGASFTLSQETTLHTSIIIQSNYNANNLLFRPMIRSSSVTDTTYEPYTGGTPSPNPDYPQEIKNVAGDNNVKIGGKNLFNPNAEVTKDTNCYKYSYYLKPNTQYTISSDCPSSTVANIYANNTSSNYRVYNNYPQIVTSDVNGYFYIEVRFNPVQDDPATFDLYSAVLNGEYYIQIEEGSTPTSYEPYITPIEKELNLKSKNLLKVINTDISDITYSFKTNNGLIKITTANSNNSFDLCKGIRNGTWLPNNFSDAEDYHLTPSNQKTYIVSIQILDADIKAGANHTLNVYTNQRRVYGTITPGYTSGTIPILITLAENEYIKSIYLWTNANSTINKLDFNLQLEEGSIATTYEPYYDYTLMKDDYITEDCVIHHKKAKMILDGTENWSDYTTQLTGLYKGYSINKKINSFYSENSKCSHFKTSSNVASDSQFFSATQYAIYISIDNSIVSNSTELKNYIKQQYDNGTPIIIEHNLVEETTETIPNTIPLYNQVKELFNIQNSNAGTLIVETESNEENARLKVAATALQSWEVNS